jgi:hypothetical protein
MDGLYDESADKKDEKEEVIYEFLTTKIVPYTIPQREFIKICNHQLLPIQYNCGSM